MSSVCKTTWHALLTADASLMCRAYLHALDATLEMPFHERNEQGAMVYNPLGMDDMEGTFEEIDLDIVDSDDEFEVGPLHLSIATPAECRELRCALLMMWDVWDAESTRATASPFHLRAEAFWCMQACPFLVQVQTCAACWFALAAEDHQEELAGFEHKSISPGLLELQVCRCTTSRPIIGIRLAWQAQKPFHSFCVKMLTQ